MGYPSDFESTSGIELAPSNKAKPVRDEQARQPLFIGPRSTGAIRASKKQAHLRCQGSVGGTDRDKENSKLGRAGEEFVVRFEQERLTDSGLPDLADAVEHVSETRGDGLGYDVRSFNDDGTERLIEVKTTRSGKSEPFFLSENERAFAELNPESFWIYRVFNFDNETAIGNLFTVRGDVESNFSLEPINYRVRR